MTSPEARAFISRKIKKLRDEGVPEKRAVAEAHSIARQRGFRVPPPPHVARGERRA